MMLRELAYKATDVVDRRHRSLHGSRGMAEGLEKILADNNIAENALIYHSVNV